MRSLYLDAASGEASQRCQRVLLFGTGRFPHSSSLMPPLWKSSSRTSSTSWKNTPNRKTDTCDKILAPAEGWVERSIPGSLGRSWLAARLVWQRPCFVAQKFVVKKHVAGMEPCLVPPQPGVSSLSQHCCWCSPAGVSFLRALGWLIPLPFPTSGTKAGSAALLPLHIPTRAAWVGHRSAAGAPQPWCRQAGFMPLHPLFQHSISSRPAELLIHTVPKPPAAARLCRWSCWEQLVVVREHFPAGARAAQPPLTQSSA